MFLSVRKASLLIIIPKLITADSCSGFAANIGYSANTGNSASKRKIPLFDIPIVKVRNYVILRIEKE
jgi:hypothetical protein